MTILPEKNKVTGEFNVLNAGKKILEHLSTNSTADRPLCFTGKNHEIIVLPYNHGHPVMFMRNLPAGKFFEVVGSGVSSCGKDKSWSFQNVYSVHENLDKFFKLYSDGSMGFLRASMEHEFMLAKELTPTDLSYIDYTPVPENRIFEYVLENPQKDIVITVDRPEIHWGYDTFRLHFFTDKMMACRPIEVVNVERFRDGGTTNVITKEGVLHCPTPWAKDKNPTWTPTGGEAMALRNCDNGANDGINHIVYEQLGSRLGVGKPLLRRENV